MGYILCGILYFDIRVETGILHGDLRECVHIELFAYECLGLTGPGQNVPHNAAGMLISLRWT